MADKYGDYPNQRIDPDAPRMESNTLTDRILRGGKSFIKSQMGDLGISPMPLGLVMRAGGYECG